MNMQDKKRVMQILYESIVRPEVDESDIVLVDYRQAKERIAGLPIEPDDPNPYNSVLELLRDFDLEAEWDGDIAELAEHICQMFKRGPYAKKG